MDTLWILQNNPKIEKLTAKVAIALRESGRELKDFSYRTDETIPRYEEASQQRSFLYGSTAMVGKAVKDEHYRASLWFDVDAFDQRAWLQNRPMDMLNDTGELMALADVPQRLAYGACFVRPIADLKAFTGVVLDSQGFAAWKQEQTARNGMLTDADLVWVSSVKHIAAEYRFFVGDHKILLGSSYRKDGKHFCSTDIPSEVATVAEQLALGWQPARLAVMDVCFLEDGQARIVEFNCAHCSGLYAIPPIAFVDAIEAFHRGLLP